VKSVTVYVSIGNSDDKLTQAGWSEFVADMTIALLDNGGNFLGKWFSLPNEPFQNACWCVEFANPGDATAARATVSAIRSGYVQESVAWAVVPETEFI
jgi:hypothetical protein